MAHLRNQNGTEVNLAGKAGEIAAGWRGVGDLRDDARIHTVGASFVRADARTGL